MKNFELKKEILIWIIVLLPLGYLYYVWNTLPEMVPTHFGIDGQPNDWSHKTTLIYLVAGIGIGVYLLLTIIPAIDPKKKIEAMGNKYFLFKLFMMLFMTALSFFTIQSAITKNISGNTLFLIVGAMFAFLGNYMQTVKPNYFIGIRTPWTLENENVWRKTHKLGGMLFLVAGILIMVLPFVMKTLFHRIFLVLVLSATFVPIVYSFICYREEKSKAEKQ